MGCLGPLSAVLAAAAPVEERAPEGRSRAARAPCAGEGSRRPGPSAPSPSCPAGTDPGGRKSPRPVLCRAEGTGDRHRPRDAFCSCTMPLTPLLGGAYLSGPVAPPEVRARTHTHTLPPPPPRAQARPYSGRARTRCQGRPRRRPCCVPGATPSLWPRHLVKAARAASRHPALQPRCSLAPVRDAAGRPAGRCMLRLKGGSRGCPPPAYLINGRLEEVV